MYNLYTHCVLAPDIDTQGPLWAGELGPGRISIFVTHNLELFFLKQIIWLTPGTSALKEWW